MRTRPRLPRHPAGRAADRRARRDVHPRPRRRHGPAARSPTSLEQSLPPIAGILLIVAAGGGFKQTLIDTGIGGLVADWVEDSGLSVLLLAWLVAVLIRLATGSATVATVTAAGILAPLVADLSTGETSLLVLAIGCGLAVLLPRQRRRLLAGQGVLRPHRRPDHQDLVGDGDHHLGDRPGASSWC